jgi:hypothetical protein
MGAGGWKPWLAGERLVVVAGEGVAIQAKFDAACARVGIGLDKPQRALAGINIYPISEWNLRAGAGVNES